jgi:hypothetical protein
LAAAADWFVSKPPLISVGPGWQFASLWLPVTAWWQWQLFRRKRYGLSEEGLWNHSGFFNSEQTLLLVAQRTGGAVQNVL